MVYADLHTHTKNSDGTLSNEELVQHAVKNGLKGLAVTDHQSFSEQKNIKRLAESSGLEYITGIELKTTIQQSLDKHGFLGLLATMEILVYGLNEGCPELAALQGMIDQHMLLKKEYYDMIRKELLKYDYSEIEGSAIKGQIIVTKEETAAGKKEGKTISQIVQDRTGVTHTAMKNFYVCTIQSKVYAELNDPFMSLDTKEAIAKARKWGKLVVLAHPLTESRKALAPFYEKAMPELVEAGLQGIEFDYPEHTEEDKKLIQKFANRHNLILTGGSDFHTPDDKLYKIGCCGVDELTFKKIQKICL